MLMLNYSKNELHRNMVLAFLCPTCKTVINAVDIDPSHFSYYSNAIFNLVNQGYQPEIVPVTTEILGSDCGCSPARRYQTSAYPTKWNGRVPKTVKMKADLELDTTSFKLINKLNAGETYHVRVDESGTIYVDKSSTFVIRTNMVDKDNYEIIEWWGDDEVPE